LSAQTKCHTRHLDEVIDRLFGVTTHRNSIYAM
jgi:hypothetical protein